MGKISEGGEWQYEKFFIHIFPLKLKKKKQTKGEEELLWPSVARLWGAGG